MDDNFHRQGLGAHAPPGYFVRLENGRTKDDLYLSKRVRMRRWFCCTCKAEESDPSHENELHKSPKNTADGGFPHPPLSFLVKLPPFVGLTDWIQRPIKASLIPWAHLDHEKQRNGSRLKASISIKYDTASDLIELMDPIAKERPNAYDEYW
ncbi:hypothetical protein FXO37_07008 [Capsicum annuum]|nr:hypothetical protein FXO37_07008 [Capsicum annuum]